MRYSYADEKISIRPWCEHDISHLFEAVSESIEVISPWLPWCHSDYEIEESQSWIHARPMAWEKAEEYSFVILDSKTDRLLGGTGINQVNHLHNYANLGYWVRVSAQGNGVATRAAILVAGFGFRELNLERIEILAAAGNSASRKVATKTGGLCEGLLRRRLKIGESYQDAVLFSLIKSEFMRDHPA